MSALLLASASVLVLIGLAFVLLFRRLGSQVDLNRAPENWLEEAPAIKYRPMERLLADADYRFLASCAGVSPAMLRRMRAERRRLFRSYLRWLSEDFSRVHTATRLFLLSCDRDRPDLALELLRQRAIFTCGLMLAELHLAVHVMGLGGIPVYRLIRSLNSARQNLTSAALPVAA